MSNFKGTTIHLSDTHDMYSRKVHVNIRNGKVTLVYRWKDHSSPKAHTQRTTLDDAQAGKLLAALAVGAAHAVGEDKAREAMLTLSFDTEVNRLES